MLVVELAGAGSVDVVDEVVVLSPAKAAPATAKLQTATAANIVDNFISLHSLWVPGYPTHQTMHYALAEDAVQCIRYISRPMHS